MLTILGTNLSLTFRFIRTEIWPVKGRKYFEMNVEMIKNIAIDKRLGGFMPYFNLYLLLSCLLSVVQGFYDQPAFMWLTFDYFGYNKLPRSVKISKTLINFTAYTLYNDAYFQFGKLNIFEKYTNVLILDDRAPVLGSNYDFWKTVRYDLAFYQMIIAAFDVAIFLCYIQFCMAMPVSSLGPPHLYPLIYLSVSIGFICFATIIFFVTAGSFTGPFALFAVKALFERLDVQRRRNLDHPINRLTPFRLLRYRRENAESMRFEFVFTKSFGAMLSTFLWTNIPLNVSLNSLFIINNMSNAIVFNLCVVIVFGKLSL